MKAEKLLQNIEREADVRLTELNHTKDPDRLVRIAGAALIWVKAVEMDLTRLVSADAAEYDRHHRMHFGTPAASVREIADQTVEFHRSKLAALAFYAVETISAAVLFAKFYVGLILVRICVGVAVAAFIGIGITAIVTRKVRREAEFQPDTMKSRIGDWMKWVGPAWLISVVGALAVPRFSAGLLGLLLFPIFTFLVTLLSPVCAALCAANGDISGWSSELAARVNGARHVQVKTNHLRDVATDIVRRFGSDDARGSGAVGGGEAPRWPKVNRMLKAGTVAMVGAVLAVANLYGAQFRLVPDVSGSVDRGQEAVVLGAITDSFASNTFWNQQVQIHVAPFVENPWTTAETAIIEMPRAAVGKCTPPAQTDLTTISRAYAEAAQRESDVRCASAKRAAETKLGNEKERALEQLRAAVRGIPALKLHGKCTAFFEAVRQAANMPTPTVSVILSDGWETCEKRSLDSIPGDPRNTVFVVPVPRARPEWGAAQNVDELRRRMAKVAPYVRVIEPFRVSEIVEAVYGSSH